MNPNLRFPEFVQMVRSRRDSNELFGPLLDRGHFYDLTSTELFPDGTTKVPIPSREYVFLPSETTIIEAKMTNTSALLVMTKPPSGDGVAIVFLLLYVSSPGGPSGWRLSHNYLLRVGEDGKFVINTDMTNMQQSDADHLIGFATSMLFLINRPRTRTVARTWGRNQRRLVRGHGGAYYNGYTEVVIQDRTVIEGDRHPSGIHKCLHYVRSHLRRYRNGQTVQVPEHWRGDAKLGVKDHRYRVKGTGRGA